MKVRWQLDLYILAICLIGLLAGAVLWFLTARTYAHWVWAVAALPAAFVLLYRMALALWRRELGVDLLALIAIVAALVLDQTLTAAVIATMLASGRLLESYAERRAAREMSALLARVPRSVNRYAAGELEQVPLDAVRPGNRLLVRHGEVVPVDGVLDAERGLLDESALTGESLPVAYAHGERLRSGAINAAAAFDMHASARAADSSFAGIVRLVEGAQQSRAPATRLADRYAAWFIPAALALAGIAWGLSGDAMRALAVVVVATPCPLILAVPVALVSGISRAAKRGILVKGGAALEALATASVLFFDKTGTLTAGQARLLAIEGAAGNENTLLASVAALEQMSNHIIAGTVVQAARARGLALRIASDVTEVPGAGVRGRLDGREIAAGSRAYIEGIASIPPTIGKLLERTGAEGTLAVCVAMDGKFAGVLLLADQIRTETPRALRLLRRLGIRRIVMLTGDRREVAEAIGTGLGVDQVLAEQTPADKLAAVQAQTATQATIMVGDGVNDAPVLAMLAAAAGYLPPLYGALLQEAIDVAVILNALRALRIRALRASRYSLSAAQTQELHDDHARLTPVLDRITTVAARLPALTPAELQRALKELNASLHQELLPHERSDDREVYPVLAELLGGDDPMAAMSRGHREIFRLAQRLSTLIAQLPAQAANADALPELQRTLYSLDAVLRLHFAQEEEIYHGLAQA